MRKVRSLGAAIILSVFILASTITAFGDTRTVKFNDIDASWAKQNIVNVYKNGLMDGITETNFKPRDNVKSFDVIVSIARMLNGTNSDNLAKYETKYKSTLDEYKVPSQYRKEVAFCIEKGILVISKNDVSTLTNNENEKSKKLYATKIDICVYLGRAFGVKPNKDIGLTYKDAIFIYSDYKSYVDFLAKKGVVSKNGNEKGEFQPYANITRETFAKMLDTANDIYVKEYKGGQNPPTETNTPPATNPSTSTTTPGNTATNTNSGNNTTVVIPKAAETYTAIVDQVIPEYGNMVVFIKESNGAQARKVYKIADNVVCRIDDANSYYYKLKKGDNITIGVTDEKIVSIIAESATKKLVGVLKDITITDRITLEMETAKGEIKKYPITEKTIIIKDGEKANYQDLNKGNNILLTIYNGEMVEVNADGIRNSDQGVIESVTYSRTAAPKVILVADGGRRGEYYISKGIKDSEIMIDGASASVYSLRPGMQVKLELVDDEITNIVTLKTVTDVKITAAIKHINIELKYIVISVYDEVTKKTVEKMVFASSSKVADEELNTMGLEQLKVGDTIRILGQENDEGIIAKSIIVEK